MKYLIFNMNKEMQMLLWTILLDFRLPYISEDIIDT